MRMEQNKSKDVLLDYIRSNKHESTETKSAALSTARRLSPKRQNVKLSMFLSMPRPAFNPPAQKPILTPARDPELPVRDNDSYYTRRRQQLNLAPKSRQETRPRKINAALAEFMRIARNDPAKQNESA